MIISFFVRQNNVKFLDIQGKCRIVPVNVVIQVINLVNSLYVRHKVFVLGNEDVLVSSVLLRH